MSGRILAAMTVILVGLVGGCGSSEKLWKEGQGVQGRTGGRLETAGYGVPEMSFHLEPLNYRKVDTGAVIRGGGRGR